MVQDRVVVQDNLKLSAYCLTIKAWSGYSRKRPQAKGRLALVDCFPASMEGVRGTPGLIPDYIPSQGGWCPWCRMELWSCCWLKALLSRRRPDAIEPVNEKNTGTRPNNLGEMLSCQNGGVAQHPRSDCRRYPKAGRMMSVVYDRVSGVASFPADNIFTDNIIIQVGKLALCY